MLGIMFRIAVLPLTWLAMLFLLVGILGTVVSVIMLAFVPFTMAFGIWIKGMMIAALGIGFIMVKERIALWVEGT